MDTEISDQFNIKFRHLAILLLIITVIWGVSALILGGRQDQDRGTFGDMFGAVNALFSGWAFAGVIFAILLQRKELALQRHELELTRQELEGQKPQLCAQNETLKLQTFENTFYHLLGLHSEIVRSIQIFLGSDREKSGRDCFREFNNYLIIAFREASTGAPHEESRVQIERAYVDFYNSWQAKLGPYLATLCQLLIFVKESDVATKRRYTDVIRAQLSTDERLLLFYHCLSSLGRDDFKPLAKEFELFQGLPPALLINGNHASLF